jgi:hypothetical protein
MRQRHTNKKEFAISLSYLNVLMLFCVLVMYRESKLNKPFKP